MGWVGLGWVGRAAKRSTGERTRVDTWLARSPCGPAGKAGAPQRLAPPGNGGPAPASGLWPALPCPAASPCDLARSVTWSEMEESGPQSGAGSSSTIRNVAPQGDCTSSRRIATSLPRPCEASRGEWVGGWVEGKQGRGGGGSKGGLRGAARRGAVGLPGRGRHLFEGGLEGGAALDLNPAGAGACAAGSGQRPVRPCRLAATAARWRALLPGTQAVHMAGRPPADVVAGVVHVHSVVIDEL